MFRYLDSLRSRPGAGQLLGAVVAPMCGGRSFLPLLLLHTKRSPHWWLLAET
jgi:hypothetical protein